MCLVALRGAVEWGITFFDTASSYGAGQANAVVARALGELLRTRRAEVQLCAKVGLRRDDQVAAGKVRDASPQFLAAEVDQTLAALGTDYIDVIMLHFPDPDTPPAETAAALAEIVKSGKARAVGLSPMSSASPGRARA